MFCNSALDCFYELVVPNMKSHLQNAFATQKAYLDHIFSNNLILD